MTLDRTAERSTVESDRSRDENLLDRYTAPIADMMLDLEVGGLEEILALPRFSQLDRYDVELPWGNLAVLPATWSGQRMDPATRRVRL
jgi:hypothetical protein